jgi:basic membrane protein A
MNRYPLMKSARLLALSAAIMTTASVSAAEIKPAVVFDMGGKFDQSFNQGVYEGVERFKKETGISYREFEVTNPSQREQAVRKMAQRGASPIISVGFAQASAVEAAADQFPEAHFTLIDAVVDKPNVQSVVFKEHEGSFLVGMIAAMKSQTHAVSFVGGMDIPLIRKFSCGFINCESSVKKRPPWR